MSGYKRYPKYRDSGVEWIGEVPEGWEVVQSHRLFFERKDRAWEQDTQFTSSQKYGVIPQTEFMEREGRRVMLVGKGRDILKHVEPGDFLISMRSFEGGLEECKARGSVSSAYVPLVPIKWAWPPFFRYLFKSSGYIQALQSTSDLVRDGQALRFENFSKVPLLRIPIEEQKIIASTIDRATARIDALVTKKTRFIALLKEKRQALITHAVTKGLNPNAKMKDSGVEWIGEVPEGWEVLPIKRLVSTPVTDGPHETPEFFDSGVPFVSAEAVANGTIDFNKIRGYISREDHERYAKKYLPRRNDIYLVKSGATTGVTAIVETDEIFNIWSPLAAIRCNTMIHPRFLLHYMRSRYFLDGVSLSWSYGTQQNIGMGVIENLPAPVPSLQEQSEIERFLDQQEKGINKLISYTHRSITLLKEKRSALITAAVTGQIDVRNDARVSIREEMAA